MPKPTVVPYVPPHPGAYIGSSKQHSLSPTLTVAQITEILEVKPKRGSGDGKCKFTWSFVADGHECEIWDYKGSRWSAFGPQQVFVDLGMSPVGWILSADPALAAAGRAALGLDPRP